MKTVYTLHNETNPDIQTEWPLIKWQYHYFGIKRYSTAFNELIGYYYWPN